MFVEVVWHSQDTWEPLSAQPLCPEPSLVYTLFIFWSNFPQAHEWSESGCFRSLLLHWEKTVTMWQIVKWIIRKYFVLLVLAMGMFDFLVLRLDMLIYLYSSAPSTQAAVFQECRMAPGVDWHCKRHCRSWIHGGICFLGCWRGRNSWSRCAYAYS